MRKGSEENNFKRLYHSNIATIVIFIVLVFSFINATKEVVLRHGIKKEINRLEEQFNELNGEKDNLENLVSYLETDEYIEEEARLKLNLSKPGEKQINLASGNDTNLDIKEVSELSNYNKWFNYFFK